MYCRDPSIKRTVCKRCDALLIPGVTCTHRLRGELNADLFYLFAQLHFCVARREAHIVVRCSTCGAAKRFLLRKNHQLWTEQPTNIHNTSTNQTQSLKT